MEIRLIFVVNKLLKIFVFQWGIKILGPNFSYLIFEAVNFKGFWGPAEMRGNDFEENKVVPLIFKQFWSKQKPLEQAWSIDPTRCLIHMYSEYFA